MDTEGIMKMQKHYCKWILALTLLPLCAQAESPNKTVLPDDFKVFQNEKVGISTKSFKGAQEKTLPTDNEYKDAPGCYIACQSKHSKEAAYHLMDNIYMMGQIRVPGHYSNGFCIPKGFERVKLSSSKDLKEKCTKSFPTQCENDSCWADGRTANWFY